MTRPFTTSDYLAIKDAFKRACEDAGTLDEISQRTRVDAALLSRYGNGIRPEFPPADVMLDVDAMCGEPRSLKAMARLAGFGLVPIREDRGVRVEDFRHHSVVLAKETGEALAAVAQLSIKQCPSAAAIAVQELTEAIDSKQRAKDDCLRVIAGAV